MKDLKLMQFESLKKAASGKWAERIIAQIGYAIKLDEARKGRFAGIIEDTIGYLYERYEEAGAITKDAAIKAEEKISAMSAEAKSIKVICAAHAHIDMNWLWGYAETVAVTLDTFRTMLNIMKEYPDYTFSQSQASVYSIVEEYDPAMLEEIKARVKEGRWEVTASTWVETDKNMPTGESLARHILYSKKYLSKLLDISPDSLQLDFEPDTFGHNHNVPEIMSKGGVKYYYHCRGYEENYIYRWKSPSGSTVLVYREPIWYNATIDKDMVLHMPWFCDLNGIDTMLKVYGVGDHGGGPTRRDVEKLVEMSAWPVFPTIKFGTFAEYFKILDGMSDRFPVVDKELNFVFTGCYTTQTRIKLANRIGEAKMNEAELFSSCSKAYAKGSYPNKKYEEAWKKILFNHFHDILPGSGVIETREYAMGQFQQLLAVANTGISTALRNISSKIDTSGLPFEEGSVAETISEGAGVGYAIYDYGVPQTERGAGKERIFHLFNPSLTERKEFVELTVWDWPGEIQRLEVVDIKGNVIRHQMTTGKMQQYYDAGVYWGHKYIRLLIEAELPACGYGTWLLREKPPISSMVLPLEPRVEKPDEFVLENDLVRVEFNTANMSIVSMVDKKSGMEMVDAGRPSGIFRLIEEDDSKGMTAWTIGRYMNIIDLNKDVKAGKVTIDKNLLRQSIAYSIKFRNSSLSVTISLDDNSRRLDYNLECDWQERAVKGSHIPQLNFHVPFSYCCKKYRYDIPFGTIVREPADMDVPANGWAVAIPDSDRESAMMLVSKTKYGFRGFDDSLSLDLIRSSYDPDPYPENCKHKLHFALEVVDCFNDNKALIEKAYDYNHPISFVSGRKHAGSLPLAESFMKLEKGTLAVSAVKMPEDDMESNQMIIRVYETDGEQTRGILKFAGKIGNAWFVDINENKLPASKDISVKDGEVIFDVDAYSMAGVCVELG